MNARPLNQHVILILVAVALFVVAFLIAVDAFDGNQSAWETGGFVALAASFYP